jgi:hypothetical protein
MLMLKEIVACTDHFHKDSVKYMVGTHRQVRILPGEAHCQNIGGRMADEGRIELVDMETITY